MTDPAASTADSTEAPIVPPAPRPGVRPTICRGVVFTLPSGPNKGQKRPALVIDADDLIADLAVMVKGCDDLGHENAGMPIKRFEKVDYDQTGETDGTWSWPVMQGPAPKSDGDVAALRAELAGLRTETMSLRSAMNSILSALDAPHQAAEAPAAAPVATEVVAAPKPAAEA